MFKCFINSTDDYSTQKWSKKINIHLLNLSFNLNNVAAYLLQSWERCSFLKRRGSKNKIVHHCWNVEKKRKKKAFLFYLICLKSLILNISCFRFLYWLTFHMLAVTGGGGRCHSQPRVFIGVQVFLKEILSVFIRYKCKVSSTLLTPILSSGKRLLLVHKCKTRPSEGLLVAGAERCDLHLIFRRGLTDGCPQDQQVQNCPVHPFCFHLKMPPCFFFQFPRNLTFSSTQAADILLLNGSEMSIPHTPLFYFHSVYLTSRATQEPITALALCT